MFAYCGNNPIARIDSLGRVWWWVKGAVSAGERFLSTLIFGGDFGDACLSAAEGFALAYVPDEAVHVIEGLVAFLDSLANEDTFLCAVGKGVISFGVSYISGSDLLAGLDASEVDELIVDLVIGFGGELCGDAVSELITQKREKPVSIIREHAYLDYYHGGGGIKGISCTNMIA